MEQKVALLLPPGIEKVMLPSSTGRGSGKVLYEDSYKVSKLKQIMTEARLQVSSARLAEDDASSLKAALGLWQNFSSRPLPVQMRGGE